MGSKTEMVYLKGPINYLTKFKAILILCFHMLIFNAFLKQYIQP